MNRRYRYLLWLLMLTLAGCAVRDGRPPVARYSLDGQPKLKSAAHWQLVANDVAAQIAAAMKPGKLAAPVAVAPPRTAGTFGKVFAAQLRSALLAQGVAVADPQPGALDVEVTVDTVRHEVFPDRYRPGTWTALAAGVLVLRGALGLHKYDEAGAIAATVAGYDGIVAAAQLTDRPATEVVLSTAVRRDGGYLMHRTDVYYIDAADSNLFQELPIHEFRLVGGQS